jgi:hypothetical protein
MRCRLIVSEFMTTTSDGIAPTRVAMEWETMSSMSSQGVLPVCVCGCAWEGGRCVCVGVCGRGREVCGGGLGSFVYAYVVWCQGF